MSWSAETALVVAKQFLLLLGQGLEGQQIAHADDAVHRRTQFMADIGQEFGLGAQFERSASIPGMGQF